MTCWNGHLPGMTDARLQQAIDEYYKLYGEHWSRAWQSPMNPLRDEPAEPAPERRTATSLQAARTSDKTGAIDVEFVRVR